MNPLTDRTSFVHYLQSEIIVSLCFTLDLTTHSLLHPLIFRYLRFFFSLGSPPHPQQVFIPIHPHPLYSSLLKGWPLTSPPPTIRWRLGRESLGVQDHKYGDTLEEGPHTLSGALTKINCLMLPSLSDSGGITPLFSTKDGRTIVKDRTTWERTGEITNGTTRSTAQDSMRHLSGHTVPQFPPESVVGRSLTWDTCKCTHSVLRTSTHRGPKDWVPLTFTTTEFDHSRPHSDAHTLLLVSEGFLLRQVTT